MATDLTTAARSLAERALSGELASEHSGREAPQRFLAVGDPQTTFDHFLDILAAHDLVGEDGWLWPEMGLVSMGDYFDFGAAETVGSEGLEAAGRDGLLIMNWLAAHPPEQVVMLLGNHDAARVMELWSIDDEYFAAARELALKAHLAPKEAREALEQEFFRRFAKIPTPEVARRDWTTFHCSQREGLQRLLLAGRLKLAVVGEQADRTVLLTHTGVTFRELDLLKVAPDAHARRIANRLNALLGERVARVRPQWERGGRGPLDLRPLVAPGTSGQEAGGFLWFRPANPERRNPEREVDLDWEFARERPRRFDPRSLPPGLVQACGHTRPGSSARELVPWTTESAATGTPGQLRTLRVRAKAIIYDAGLLPIKPGDAVLYMLDAELNEAPALQVELFELDSVEISARGSSRPPSR